MSPRWDDGSGTYEAAASIMALATEDPEANRSLIATIATYIVSRQNANGSWDYIGRTPGDTSISQYAVLGLWEAENAGVEIPPAYLGPRGVVVHVGAELGGKLELPSRRSRQPETCAMTAAGIGSLLICQRQLDRYRSTAASISPLLTPLVTEGSTAIQARTSTAGSTRPSTAASRGFRRISPPTTRSWPVRVPYYMLYGVERIGALAEQSIARQSRLVRQGRDFIRSTQQPDGSWNSHTASR